MKLIRNILCVFILVGASILLARTTLIDFKLHALQDIRHSHSKKIPTLSESIRDENLARNIVRRGIVEEDANRQKIRESLVNEYNRYSFEDLCNKNGTVSFQKAAINYYKYRWLVSSETARGIYDTEYYVTDEDGIIDLSRQFDLSHKKLDEIADEVLIYGLVEPIHTRTPYMANFFAARAENQCP